MIAVVIPSYRVKAKILGVIANVGPEVEKIIVVDDACPEKSGAHVIEFQTDPRVEVIKHEINRGVGGATVSGYKRALELGAKVLVKLDGDGQVDPGLIPQLVAPIQQGRADYVKGNRFYDLKMLRQMPSLRLLGNSILSFVNKLTSGYWGVMDPSNGFTAIHANCVGMIDLDRLDHRYFFESDMLFRLGTVRAAIAQVPMVAKYEDENSSL